MKLFIVMFSFFEFSVKVSIQTCTLWEPRMIHCLRNARSRSAARDSAGSIRASCSCRDLHYCIVVSGPGVRGAPYNHSVRSAAPRTHTDVASRFEVALCFLCVPKCHFSAAQYFNGIFLCGGFNVRIVPFSFYGLSHLYFICITNI